MLSNITNYLFGGQGSATNEKENINFQEVEDDDWMVVDKLAEKRNDETNDDLIVSSQTYINLTASYLKAESQNSRPPVPEKSSSRRRSISCKRLINRRCSTPLRELSPACATSKAVVPCAPKKGSRSSSKSSSCGMEESWYITPPPCFVSGPYETKPSSLENLLIEQPGPHYIGYVDTIEKLRLLINVKDESTSEKCESKTTNKEEPFNVFFEAPPMRGYEDPQPEDNRRMLLEAREQKKMINTYQSQINSAQKVEQKIPNQFSKRNQMDRLNKVQYELSSRKKRQRRADLNKKHSGVNNNRKCCY